MRTFIIRLSVDWDDYEEVEPELILEDAIVQLKDGVSIEIIEEQLP